MIQSNREAIMRKTISSIAAAAIVAFWATTGYSQNALDTLVCQDIGSFKKLECVCRAGSGILVPAGHFGKDHKDMDCDVTYYSAPHKMTITADVTRHADPPEAIKWLFHEMDKDFRSYYGTPEPGYSIRNLDGNTIYTFASAGWNYRWISGNNVIMLEYHDTGMKKPEPIEVVRAYLAKYPSPLSTMSTQELRNASNETKWIKDEMDRRLWLCNKWLLNPSVRKDGQIQVREEALDSMNIFLNYRERYFGINAADEKNLLAGYYISNNSAGLKAKLMEYRDWWTANKDKKIHT
jgi:hypothetical protein